MALLLKIRAPEVYSFCGEILDRESRFPLASTWFVLRAITALDRS
jgi:hypothetical protein